jgi:hypothetical protein
LLVTANTDSFHPEDGGENFLRNFGVVFLRSVIQMLVIVNVVVSTLMMNMIRSSETSILTRTTWRHTPEDGILHSYRSENHKSYIALTG